MHDVMISYSSKDKEIVGFICSQLEANNIKVWIAPRDLKNKTYLEGLLTGIKNCKIIVLVFTNHANHSNWVPKEIERGVNARKIIIPVKIEDVLNILPDFEMCLSTYHWIDAVNQPMEQSIHLIISTIKSILENEAQTNKKVTSNQSIEKANKAYKQYIQITKEIISFMSSEFVNMNLTLVTIDEAFKEWKNFRRNYSQFSEIDQKQLRIDFIAHINHHKEKLNTTYSKYKLSSFYEKILTANSVPTEDIKGFYLIRYNDEAINYLNSLQYWAKSPESGWLTTLDEGIEVLTDFNKELIVGNIYAFFELMVAMPIEARESFYKFQPLLTKFPDIGLNRTKQEFESLQNKSWQLCNELLTKYASLIGDDSKVVDRLKHLYKKKLKKEIDVKEKTKQMKLTYKKLLDKCSFTADEEQGMMWGKILRLVTFGYEAIKNEEMYHDEYLKLKKEAGKGSAMIKESFPIISSKQVFQDVQNLLDVYLAFNIKSDPASKFYVFAAQLYFKLVSEHKLAPEGVLMVGTKDNLPHPTFIVGDIIIERKGRKILGFNDYFNLKDDRSPDIVKILRFSSSGQFSIITEEVKTKNILIGLMNLQE